MHLVDILLFTQNRVLQMEHPISYKQLIVSDLHFTQTMATHTPAASGPAGRSS